ncbi:NAD-dependent epimerase/dehydratase family protein [Nonomuraea sp. NPDC049028]|uniref:NAD-dependent epimerase/dehydratase family protein n=1 Tax=Nonomuraea sp. NPDC049028 TaxID=3364348 RepID=UPI00371F6D95
MRRTSAGSGRVVDTIPAIPHIGPPSVNAKTVFPDQAIDRAAGFPAFRGTAPPGIEQRGDLETHMIRWKRILDHRGPCTATSPPRWAWLRAINRFVRFSRLTSSADFATGAKHIEDDYSPVARVYATRLPATSARPIILGIMASGTYRRDGRDHPGFPTRMPRCRRRDAKRQQDVKGFHSGSQQFSLSRPISLYSGEENRSMKPMDTVDRPAGKRIVVTGVAGFIGSHIARSLLDDGHEVIGIDHCLGHPPEITERNLRLNETGDRFTLIRGDLAEIPLEHQFDGADTVFHIAARPGVRPSWGAEFPSYARSNIVATHLLMEAAARTSVRRVVVSSSSSVYGGAPNGPVTEADLPAPLSPYGVTKLAAEQLALAHARRGPSGPTVVALRYFTVYGPRQRRDMLISKLIESALSGKTVTILGDGKQRRDFTFVADAVQANVMAMHAEVEAEALNIGTGVTTSVLDVADLVGDIVGRPVVLEFGSGQAGDVRDTHADVSLAKDVIGYRPTIDLRTGLTTQVEWTLKNEVIPAPE